MVDVDDTRSWRHHNQGSGILDIVMASFLTNDHFYFGSF